MRNTTVRTLMLATTLAAVLATTSPLAAREAREAGAPRDVESPIVRTVKQVVKKVFGITLNSSITIPKP